MTAFTPIYLDNVQKGARIAVAMSGGVDSSVAAALMVEAGYQVVGITLQLYDQGEMANKKGACCAGQDIYDARTVADKLGFPHYVLDYESLFKQKVIDDFVSTYLQGETPIPCIRCNQQVKFKDLLTTARDLGAEALVTGHYVQRLNPLGKSQLWRAVDHHRDQSYFLFATTQAELDYLRFPLGHMSKSETRGHARRFGLIVSEKPDSQDICFVPNGNYTSIVTKLRPDALEPGDIVDLEGKVLGHHQGIIAYTIGQRKGLGISSSTPLYVIRLEPETKKVVIGPRAALAKDHLTVKDINWLEDPSLFETGYICQVKIRSTHHPVPAIVSLIDFHNARVNFVEPEYGVSAGQACVFFDQNRVLGGGWISA